jgi:hypothetical protein
MTHPQKLDDKPQGMDLLVQVTRNSMQLSEDVGYVRALHDVMERFNSTGRNVFTREDVTAFIAWLFEARKKP